MGFVKNIAVVGMGYVGLTLSTVMAERGFFVHGVETNNDVLQDLVRGIPHFKENGLSALLAGQQRNGHLKIQSSLPESPMDAYVISVGTPIIKGTKEPNVDYIKNSVSTVAKHLRDHGTIDSIVMLRSTVPVGLSRELVIPQIEQESGKRAGQDFLYAFAPERTIEGNALAELRSNSQIIGGIDDRSVSAAAEIFRHLTPTIVAVSSLEAAEMIKIMDNTYRDVRFAYANEMAMVCEHLGLDASELINAANTHYPRNNIPLPSPGVGGACLSKDPHILRYFAKKHGYDPLLISRARDINESIPTQIVDRIDYRLTELGKDLKSAKIFVAGFAFKGTPETSDLRDSTTLWFIDALKSRANNIYGYDPVVAKKEIAALGVAPVSIDEGIAGADVALFMNNHRSYRDLDPSRLIDSMRKPAIFYDAWRMFPGDLFNDSGVDYMGVGK